MELRKVKRKIVNVDQVCYLLTIFCILSMGINLKVYSIMKKLSSTCIIEYFCIFLFFFLYEINEIEKLIGIFKPNQE